MLGNVALNYYIMDIELTCVKCTESVNGGYVLKLQNKDDKVMVSPFGTTTQKKQVTYYMKVGTPVTLGFKGIINPDNYKVTEMPYEIPEFGEDGITANVNAGEIVQNKWLFL